MIDSLVEQLGARMAAEFDTKVNEAINKRLGHDKWTLEEMRGRLHSVHQRGKEYEVFYLDGYPLLGVSDIKVQYTDDGRATATRAYEEYDQSRAPAPA